MTRRDATVGVTSGVDREYVLFRPISLSRRSERASGWRHRVAPASTPSEAKRAFPLTPLTGNVDLDYSGAGVSLATFTNSASHGDPEPTFRTHSGDRVSTLVLPQSDGEEARCPDRPLCRTRDRSRPCSLERHSHVYELTAHSTNSGYNAIMEGTAPKGERWGSPACERTTAFGRPSCQARTCRDP